MTTNIKGSREPLFTFPHAASQLGIPASTLRRAVKKGLVPYHRPFSKHIHLRLTEVEAAIATCGMRVPRDTLMSVALAFG